MDPDSGCIALEGLAARRAVKNVKVNVIRYLYDECLSTNNLNAVGLHRPMDRRSRTNLGQKLTDIGGWEKNDRQGKNSGIQGLP